MTVNMFEVGDKVQRLLEYCNNEFEGHEKTIFTVTWYNHLNNSIRISPMGNDVRSWDGERFKISEEVPFLDLKGYSITDLMELEELIEEEYERRTEKRV